MMNFGKKLRERREFKGLSQQELAKKIGSIHTVIGRYERDEMKPSIEVVKNLAEALDTTVGYLLDESNNSELLKDSLMMERLNEINQLTEKDKECVLSLLDAFIAKTKIQSILR
ncbi:helix-turn-helix domain-containing protein [Flavobacterium covae]|uniref:helix-turn-helix domain-containing protein n=1 Tax=Flavobacterium covae TaxID=2906076 RepID=UPI003394371C